MAKNYYQTVYVNDIETLCIDQDIPVSEDGRDFAFEKFFVTELLERIQKADTEALQVKSMTRVLSIISGLIKLKDNRNNIIYASISELARILGVSRNTAYRYLKTFEELGLITNLSNSRWQLDPAVFAHMHPGQRKNILIRYKAVKKLKEDVNQRKLFDEQEAEVLEAVNA